MKHGKKYVDSRKAVDSNKQYASEEALSLVCTNAKAKFDETVEAHIRLGVDSRHADQQVRGAVVLPNGTGKKVRVCVFCKENKYEAAQAAGAVKDLVAEANAKVMAFTTNKLDPLFENNDLKASGTGIYQEVFDTVDYDGVAGADVVDTLLDGMSAVGYTV